jgi:Mg-chelatase subunit ChlD
MIEEEARVLALEKKVRDREKALEKASSTLSRLEAERKVLARAVGRARADAESRFAGIALTGRRVVFLVDSSGSMEMLDEDTPAPHKWKEVRNTVAKLMRSLPHLEEYQVITFAATTAYPLGGRGRWHRHGKGSVERVLKGLRGVKPKGGTNMYAALKEAFAYREEGLDTIYLLSDGLPNQGEGLPPGAYKLSEILRGTLLGKHVRATLKDTWNRPRGGKRVTINTVGFFYESPDLGAFLWALARENGGSFVGMSTP